MVSPQQTQAKTNPNEESLTDQWMNADVSQDPEDSDSEEIPSQETHEDFHEIKWIYPGEVNLELLEENDVLSILKDSRFRALDLTSSLMSDLAKQNTTKAPDVDPTTKIECYDHPHDSLTYSINEASVPWSDNSKVYTDNS